MFQIHPSPHLYAFICLASVLRLQRAKRGDTALNKNGWCPLEELRQNYTCAGSLLSMHPLHIPAWLWMNSYCLGTDSHCVCSLVPITSLHPFEQIFLRVGGLKEHLKSQGHQGSPVPPRMPLESLPCWKTFLACGCLMSVSVFVNSSFVFAKTFVMGFATHRDRTRLCLSKSLTWLHFKVLIQVSRPPEAQGISSLCLAADLYI